jgi:hypothetical protein
MLELVIRMRESYPQGVDKSKVWCGKLSTGVRGKEKGRKQESSG